MQRIQYRGKWHDGERFLHTYFCKGTGEWYDLQIRRYHGLTRRAMAMRRYGAFGHYA